MAALGYLQLTGTIQGEIEGGATRSGHEQQIEFLHFEHTVEMAKGNQSGMPLGVRVHRPLSIRKVIDQSTPRLMQLLCEEERLSEALFSWYAPNSNGEQELYYSVRLQNAFVTAVHAAMPDFTDERWDGLQMMETVSFIYEKIAWSWGADGTVEFEDEWS